MSEESNVTFTEEEMKQINELQVKYQQRIFELGQVELTKTDLEQQLENLAEQRKKVFESWNEIQTEESNLLKSLSDKYGDGVLNIKDGTFTPSKKE